MRVINRKSTVIKLAVIVFCVMLAAATFVLNDRQKAWASAFGPSASHTNAPGEDNCTACHVTFPVNSGTGSIQIAGLPHDYLPGQQVPITVTTSQSDAIIYGFQLTAIDRLGSQVGTVTLPVQNPARTQIINGIVGGNNRQYVEHTVDGLTPSVFGSNSWTFTWTAPAQRVGKISFYAAGNAANSDGGPSGDYIYTKSTATLSGSAISNFDGDFASDLAVYRPSIGVWYSYSILNNTFQAIQFGAAEDRITPGDYDGDGTTDFAVFRPSTGVWWIWRSSLGIIGVQWGANGDVPVQGDYDGDGKTDIAVYRPSNGVWYLFRSTKGVAVVAWGVSSDKPVQGDYDGDGKTDIAVYRPSNGIWYLIKSSGGIVGVGFGISEDKPVQADYDGDGKTDIAVYRPSNGVWYILNSSGGVTGVAFGVSTDTPTPADYDGDGKTDIAVYRPSTGIWYIFRISDSSTYGFQFGASSDVPVPAGYLYIPPGP